MVGEAGMRGTNTVQDSRFADKEAKSLKSTKFPPSYNIKVDLRKVNIGVLRTWIAAQVTALVGFEDDILVEFVFGMLESKDDPMPDPRKVQISLTGFMNAKGAAYFMERLWDLLISAQNTPGGVPQEFIDAKKVELQSLQVQERKPEGGRAADMRDMNRPSTRNDGGNGRFDGGRYDGPGPGRFNGPGPGRFDGPGQGGFDNRGSYPPRAEPMRPQSNGPPPRGAHIHPSRRQPSPSRRREDDWYPPRERRRHSPEPARRGRSPSRTPPRRGRDRSDSRSPPRRSTKARSGSRSPIRRSRARSESRTPPRRGRNRSESRTPPRRVKDRSPSRTPPRKTRDRSVSDTPPRRERSVSRTPPRRRDPSRSRTPPRRRERSLSRDDSPPRRKRERGTSRTPPRKRDRRISSLEVVKSTLEIKGKGKAKSRWEDDE